jgi:predicted nuclease of predicted toxin-antitoxin system
MRFLANENFPKVSVHILRQKGHDISAVIESSPGAKDPDVLKQAAAERRIILTFDRDYGELLYKSKPSDVAAVVYFRFFPATPEEPAEFVLRVLNLYGLSLERMFTIVERSQVRQRPLPSIE